MKKPHILLNIPPASFKYTSTKSGRNDTNSIHARNRAEHGNYLLRKLNESWAAALSEQQAVIHNSRNGVYLEFSSDPDFTLALSSLEDLRKNIRLVNVRRQTEVNSSDSDSQSTSQKTLATVYIPNIHKKFFLDKIEQYLTKTTAKEEPRNKALINNIADIRKALLVESFWLDSIDLIPRSNKVWVEVWLRDDGSNVLDSFERLLESKEIQSSVGHINFPERLVKVILADDAILADITNCSDYIAEYRIAKTLSVTLPDLPNREQALASQGILDKVEFSSDDKVFVCILDTGVNNYNPLISPALASADCMTIVNSWGSHDDKGHGTLMAGAVLYGDLNVIHTQQSVTKIRHKLESVKLLPPSGQNKQNLWGYFTSQAISHAEINANDRQRIICMAVTSNDTEDRGRPTSWSSSVDQIAFGLNDSQRKLVILSAGNAAENHSTIHLAVNYPSAQLTESVQDPAQSWNALTVGAYTEFINITDPNLSGYSAVAPRKGLSPFSTTSLTWDENKWPIKPELVLEGGNLAFNNLNFATESDELSIISTYFNPQIRYFDSFSMTSAAAAQLSRMSAIIQANNTDFWPETIRGLLVHSSSWSDTLRSQFLQNETKTSYKRLLGICGYGIPDLDKALSSANNSLTLISQQEIQPFEKDESKSALKTNEMHLHELPWPRDVLIGLPFDTKVEMRITLSYFIEPGPGEIGWKDRYRYSSHGLRFELISPGETKENFKKRINKAARNADEGAPETQSPSDHWVLGSQARDRGSIHSDIWKGTAQELASSNLIAITPTIGWWRERAYLGKWANKTRYSLVVSISTPDESIDLYTPVAIQAGVPVEVVIST